jgi:hypothetical protein
MKFSLNYNKGDIMEKNPHHLVLGEMTDFITGEKRIDTLDERYRQKIAKYLVHNLGYSKNQILQNQAITIRADQRTATIRMDFLITEHDRTCMMIKYAPGSLVTRRLSNLALSRMIHPYQIPFVVTTNGEDAEIINGLTGKVLGQGLSAIPSKEGIMGMDLGEYFPGISDILFEKASRIAYAYEVDGACPCDTDVCMLEPD